MLKSDLRFWGLLADKYRVREYIASKGYGETLIPLLGMWERGEDIDFSKLPKQFVLKTNCGSGDVKIIRDRDSADVYAIRKYFSRLLKQTFGIYPPEPHYQYIKPCVVAEALMDKDKQPVKSTSLIDYKFWCFNGRVALCWVVIDRIVYNLKMAAYDPISWKCISEEALAYSDSYKKIDIDIPKPRNLEAMVKMASDLSSGHPQCRVDLYEVDGKIYFGEMTLTSAAGGMHYFSEKYQRLLGERCREAYNELKH